MYYNISPYTKLGYLGLVVLNGEGRSAYSTTAEKLRKNYYKDGLPRSPSSTTTVNAFCTYFEIHLSGGFQE